MAILKIAHLGHPILRRQAMPLTPEEIRTPEVQRLVDDMIETMREHDGAGLAAPQVHEPLQVVVYEVASNPRYPEAEDIPLTVLINPVVTPATEEKAVGWEGCLSIPELRGKVPRYTTVRVEALDREGKPVAFEATGFHAVVIQHETDHLQGILFVDRMEDLRTLTHLAEYERYWAEEEA